MPIPGNGEPGAFSGQQQSINFSSAIPIKKRRFAMIQLSPSPEEKPPIFEDQDSKNKQESNITGEGLSLSDARNTGSPSNSDVNRTPVVAVKKEVTSTSAQLGLADVDMFASKPLEVKPSISLGDLGNKNDILRNEKSSEPEVSNSCMGALTATVKQEPVGSHQLELSTAELNVESSLGQKKLLVSVVERQNTQDTGFESDKSDSSLLGLPLPEEKLVLHENNDRSIDNLNNQECANRSNWDLNTTMDVWEGSTVSVGSCSSSNIEKLKSSSVTREFASNHSIESVLPSSLSLEKLVDRSLINSEVVMKHNQESCKSKDANVLESAGRVMQHQESSASSFAVPVPSMPQNTRPSRLSTCSELTSTGDLSNTSEQSFHSKKLHNNDTHDELITPVVSEPVSQHRQCNVGNFSVMNPEQCESDRVDEQTFELCHYGEGAANDEEKVNLSTEMVEEDYFGSDCESQQHCAVDAICHKEDEEYEDGEILEHLRHSAGEDPIVEGKKTEKLEPVKSDSGNLPTAEQNVNTPDFEGKDAVKKNLDGTSSDTNRDCVGVSYDPNSEDNSFPELSDNVLEAVIDEKRSIIVTLDERLDMSEKEVQCSPEKELSGHVPTDRSHGIGVELDDEPTDKVVKENCSGEDDSTLSKAQASLNGQDVSKVSNDVGNNSQIIKFSRASVVTTPSRTKSIPNRLLTSRSGKEKYSDHGWTQPRGNRYEFFPNKFVKDGDHRVHDQPFRNSRPNFTRGKGRISGRFGSLRSEWNSDHDFASATSYGPSDYRVMRHKHASSISDVEPECNGYGIPQDGTARRSNRRKAMDDEFPSPHLTSFRRLSSGHRDGPVTRGSPMLQSIPRNVSRRQCPAEPGSDIIRWHDKFMRHLSDDIIGPVYSHPQTMYDELDSQVGRGNRKFSTLQRKGYPRIRSRSRTRSPGPCSSPRRRSPNGLHELTQHRSPPLLRTRRMRSPDRASYRDEMIARSRGSPSYAARHSNDLRDVDSGREHVHPRSPDSSRRSSPGRGFPRSTRRADALDSREMGYGNEYMNGPLQTNKFHELHDDGSIDERRKFTERRGPLRSFWRQ